MKKIKTLQELQAEKARLRTEIREERSQMLEDFRGITKNLTPLSIGATVGKSLISSLFSAFKSRGKHDRRKENDSLDVSDFSNGFSAASKSSWLSSLSSGNAMQMAIEYGSAWLISKMVRHPLLKMITVIGLPIIVKYIPILVEAIRRLFTKEEEEEEVRMQQVEV